jgi:hypothetical protein
MRKKDIKMIIIQFCRTLQGILDKPLAIVVGSVVAVLLGLQLLEFVFSSPLPTDATIGGLNDHIFFKPFSR